MKRNLRKLALSRETLKNLTSHDLRNLPGGLYGPRSTTPKS
jgi:hypothetical protein